MNDATHLVFVYGTLKRGFCRNGVLHGERFISEAKTLPRYRMFDCGEYPALVERVGSGIPVAGEVWQVTKQVLLQLDEIEAVDQGLYYRSEVFLQKDFEHVVQAYFYNQSIAGLPDAGECWVRNN